MVGTPEEELARVVVAVTESAGSLEPEVRGRLVRGESVDGPLGALADVVRAGGLGVTDAHVQALRTAGYGEDAVFECIVAAALSAGMDHVRMVEKLLGAGP